MSGSGRSGPMLNQIVKAAGVGRSTNSGRSAVVTAAGSPSIQPLSTR